MKFSAIHIEQITAKPFCSFCLSGTKKELLSCTMYVLVTLTLHFCFKTFIGVNAIRLEILKTFILS